MVHAEVLLEAIRRKLTSNGHYTGIVNQYVEYGVARLEFRCKLADALKRSQIA